MLTWLIHFSPTVNDIPFAFWLRHKNQNFAHAFIGRICTLYLVKTFHAQMFSGCWQSSMYSSALLLKGFELFIIYYFVIGHAKLNSWSLTASRTTSHSFHSVWTLWTYNPTKVAIEEIIQAFWDVLFFNPCTWISRFILVLHLCFSNHLSSSFKKMNPVYLCRSEAASGPSVKRSMCIQAISVCRIFV